MAVRLMLKEKPFARHQNLSHRHLDLPSGNRTGDSENAVPRTGYRSCTATRSQRPLPLLAVFAAVSAIIFLAYLCSMFIRRRILAISFARKLAASENDEGSDESDSCVTETEIPGAPQDPQSRLMPSPTVLLSVERGLFELGTSPYRERTAATQSTDVSQARPQLQTAGKHMSVKRKEIDGASGERRMKLPRVEVPMQETPLGPPPSPLDPDVDLLVDSMLPGCEDELTENFWLFDDDSTCLELQSGRAALTEEFVGQQSLPPRTQTDQSSPGLSADLSTVDGSDSASTTLLTSLESVLSESSFTSPGLSPEDWLSSSDAEAVGEALGVTAFTGMPYELLDILENSKAAKRYGWLSAAASDGRIDVEALSSSEASQSDSSSDVIQVGIRISQRVLPNHPLTSCSSRSPLVLRDEGCTAVCTLRIVEWQSADVSLRARATELSKDHTHAKATSVPEPSILRSLLSSTHGRSDMRLPSRAAAEASLQTGGPAKQQSGTAWLRMSSTEPSTRPTHEIETSAVESSFLRSLLSSTSGSSAMRFPSSATAEASLQTGGPAKQQSGTAWLRMSSTEPSTRPTHEIETSAVESSFLRSLLSSTSGSSAMRLPSSATAEVSLQTGGPAKQSADVSLRARAPEQSTAPEQGMAASTVETTVVRSSLPSTADSSAIQDSVGTMTEDSLQAVEQTEQLLSSRARSATEGLIAAFGYLGEILGGVSHEVLRTHPFYRHAGRQQNLSGRSFSEEKAASSYVCHASAVPLLSECRRLLKKLRLTKEELEKLLDYTERLSGYASTHMPAHNRPSTTSYAVETLGRVFLILDTLYCAAEVLGDASKKDSWWPSIVHHIENARSTVFKNAKWDNWRKDSSEWHNSIKPSGQESAPSTKQSTSHRF